MNLQENGLSLELERKLAARLYEFCQTYERSRAAAKAVMEVLSGDGLDDPEGLEPMSPQANGLSRDRLDKDQS